jgi:hypothetical protein
VDLIELTLNHGLFVVRAAQSLAEAEAILAEWQPHMTVIDMDHDDSTALLERLGASNTLRGAGRRSWVSLGGATCRQSSRRSISGSTTS